MPSLPLVLDATIILANHAKVYNFVINTPD